MGKEKNSQLEIKLSRYNRVYQPGETVSGTATVSTNGGLAHSGIHLKVEGTVALQLSANAVGLFEAFSSNFKPVQLIGLSKQVQPAGKLGDGRIVIPFEFTLLPAAQKQLLDTYHGVFICVQYTLTVEVLKSGMFGQTMTETTEFIVEVPNKTAAPQRCPAHFTFSSDSIKKSRGTREAGQTFSISGMLESSSVCVSSPITGKVTVKETSRPISTISLQLIRVETICPTGEGSIKEASEVQCVQVARGHVMENFELPIHVVMPRLFSAPSIHEKLFQLDFEVNLLVEFDNGFTAIENIPLKIWR
mmetsp:Transcript_74278/g.108929  ORF Transcript_74278/g.108929 Transcript_74278/m.108929 type:complete len:304 (+) Transcript_74278:57-968(+)